MVEVKMVKDDGVVTRQTTYEFVQELTQLMDDELFSKVESSTSSDSELYPEAPANTEDESVESTPISASNMSEEDESDDGCQIKTRERGKTRVAHEKKSDRRSDEDEGEETESERKRPRILMDDVAVQQDKLTASSLSSSSSSNATTANSTTRRRRSRKHMTQEEKKEAKRKRNRELAAQSRTRRKIKMENLEKENIQLKLRVTELETLVEQLSESKPNESDANVDKAPTSALQPNPLIRSSSSFHDLEFYDKEWLTPLIFEEDTTMSKGTKLAAGAMAMSMSLIMLTDNAIQTAAGGTGSNVQSHLAGLWTVAWNFVNMTEIWNHLSANEMLSHFMALAFGLVFSLSIIGMYYTRLSTKRHITYQKLSSRARSVSFKGTTRILPYV